MKNVLAIQLCDYYKNGHWKMYDKRITKLVSYYSIRGSRLPKDKDYVVNFGLQAFCREYLVEYWDMNFFSIPWEVIHDQLSEFYRDTFVYDEEFIMKLKDLHKLGYLPLRIYEIPEGGLCSIKTPIFMMETTDARFPWIGEFIESLVSSFIWKMNLDATVGHWYRSLVNDYYRLTADNSIRRDKAISDFGFRGANTPEAGVRTSAAWLCSFSVTATCGAVEYIKEYYGSDDTTYKSIGGGTPSTEHSVMCSSYAIDGCEESIINRLLTEIYPHDNFTMVSDSYDYWNVVNSIIPSMKDIIMGRTKLDGTPAKILVRGDSGDPVKIVAGMVDITEFIGHKIKWYYSNNLGKDEIGDAYLTEVMIELQKNKIIHDRDFILNYCYVTHNNIKYSISLDYEFDDHLNIDPVSSTDDFTDVDTEGTVESLWRSFGGTINSKGYKVLDPHVGVIYGDSITLTRARYIYEILAIKGFSSSNVALGAGSFSFHCLESNGELLPFTRDSYNAAIKATYAELSDGSSVMIFKDPRTDTGKFKKSLRGCCQVGYDESTDRYHLVKDGLTLSEFNNLLENPYVLIFENGKISNKVNISEIRQRLYHGNF